jgi:hypothetical protein
MEFKLIYSFFINLSQLDPYPDAYPYVQCYGFRTKNSGSGSKNFETDHLVFESKNRQSGKIDKQSHFVP